MQTARSLRVKRVAFFAALAVLAAAGAYYLAITRDYRNLDFFTFWLSGRFLGSRLDPYDPGLWRAAHLQYGSTNFIERTFLYPVWMSVVSLPFGALPPQLSYGLWMLVSTAAVITAVIVAGSPYTKQIPFRLLAAFIPSVFLFFPVFVGLYYGQNQGLSILILALTLALWDRKKWLPGGMILAVLIIKPQMGLSIIFLLGCWLFYKRRWDGIAGIALGGLLLTGISLILDPDWISRWMGVASNKFSSSMGDSATAWGIARSICGIYGPCMLSIGTVLVLLLFAIYLLILPKLSHLSAVEAGGVAIAVGLLLPPYLITYDMAILIIPIICLAMRFASRGTADFWVAVFPLAITVLSVVVVVISTNYWHPGGLSGMVGHTVITLTVLAVDIGTLLRPLPAFLQHKP